MLYFLLFLITFFLFVQFVGYLLSGPKYKGPRSDHFDGKQFINPGNVKAKSLPDVIRWMLERKRGEWKMLNHTPYGEKPVERVKNGIRITFVNHSTFLIQTEGLNILTDPVWSRRASPFSWAGPERMRPPGILFEDLPEIDIVLLSHNHYDHLDLPTMQRVFKQYKPKIITPLGVNALLDTRKITGAHDLDWWDNFIINDSTSIQAVPAQHFSSRGGTDKNATLWCGYIIKRKEGNIYFAGDSGYNDKTFKEIGERCAPIQIALIPIGAYKPGWFMSPVHCSPEEAVKIHLDVKAVQSIAAHFGTFPLADEGQEDPVTDLTKALTAHQLPEDCFLALKEGEPKNFFHPLFKEG